MEFRVLGDLEVWHEGSRVPLGAHQQRAVLAILIVHVGEVVSVDRLMDWLWDGDPPARAAKAVHVHVSRLRQALAAGGVPAPRELIVTSGHGYALRAEPGDVDHVVFARLLAEGRRAYAAQEFERASGVLADALALWRGPALADFGFDAFAADEIARLEELRLEALEIRIDADLELGRHAAVVAELELLTGRYPHRERLERQRMLALYRCGRQPEALAVYRSARATLVSELGIEPSPALRELHTAILRQDAALNVNGSAATPQPDAAGRAPRRRGAVLGVALVACAAIAALVMHARGSSRPVVAGANSVAVIDPARDAVVDAIAVGARPADIAAAAGRLWVANVGDRTVSEIDPRSATVRHVRFTGGSIDSLAAGGDSVWTIDHRAATATRLDPVFGSATRTVRLGPRPVDAGTGSPNPIAVANGSVWASTGDAMVARIDPHARAPERGVAVGNDPAAIAVGDGAVWVADDADDDVTRIDGAGHVSVLPVGQGASGIALGYGAVWVANTLAGTVTRIDPATRAPVVTVRVGLDPHGIAVGLGAVWVANRGSASVSRIDPRTDRVVRTIKLGGSPQAISIAGGRLWVTVQAAAPPLGGQAAGGTLRIVQTTDKFGSGDPAVMLSFGPSVSQLEYATCAKLLDYPDRAGTQATRLVPEVAARMPSVSPDGRTYTFTLRSGFRFSPSSGQPVTAGAFQRALERFLSPRISDSAGDFGDIVGVGAYRAGRTAHIAGVTATANRLTVRLVAPAPSLPARMAMPAMCAVPPGTPIRAGGVPDIASAGPYYIASNTPGSELVLRRNPNYRGTRPRRFETIDYHFGFAPARATALVEAGRADYADSEVGQLRYASAVSPAVDARLERDYGPHSQAARSGRQRYFIDPGLATQYLLLNPRRPLFADARARRAVGFAIDRPTLARYAQPGMAMVATDQFLPPSMPGYRPANLFPVGGPDPARARSLFGPHRAHAVMYTCNDPDCLNLAETVSSNLRAIGIALEIKQFTFAQMWAREMRPREPYDIGLFGWIGSYPDPQTFFGPGVPGLSMELPGTTARHYRQRIAAVATLSGDQRLRAYGQLDADLASRAVPAVAFASTTSRDFFSPRIGCQIYQPIYGIDLGALCQRH